MNTHALLGLVGKMYSQDTVLLAREWGASQLCNEYKCLSDQRSYPWGYSTIEISTTEP